MLVPMTRVRIVARRTELARVLEELHRLGLVELEAPPVERRLEPLTGSELRTARRDELRFLLAEIDALLALLPETGDAPLESDPVPGEVDADAVRRLLARLTPQVERATARLDALHDEEVVLPRYVDPLRRLVALVPELAELDDDALARLHLDTIALVLNTEDERVVETLRGELEGLLGARFELVWTRVEHGVIGCVVVFPHDASDAVHALLGREHVRHIALPEAYGRLSLSGAVEAMERRLAELPAALAAAAADRRAVLAPDEGTLRTLHAGIDAELEQLDAHEQLTATRRTVVAHCWVPRQDLARLARELEARVGREVVVEELETSARDRNAPVLMRNRALARPFELLVRFLDLPRHGAIDPTLLTALFLPLMFGVMVGDVGYGAILLVLSLWGRRRLAGRSPVAASLSTVLLLGAAWSIVFGVLFGELFGDLGKRLWGDWAVWMYRPGGEALEPLLLFAVAIGAAHVVLGLVLGAWQAARFREHRVVLDKLGTLLVLAGLFALAGWAADHLPGVTVTPAVAAIVVGLVLVMSLHGALGVAMGPLELIGTLGNVLSYLRLAAVGLASAYLAIVANELAVAGPIWMGILIAAFFHALNLALAAFSPMIQALRLHYVEFFSKFLAGGGRPFRPFGGRAARSSRSET
ncbi:MAG TPA: V-type ATPase 116kDa subunit family protein [Gaiellaceae bacterium]|nr:V-type ATPase 116kDa subunit family protein [Gaiellaceae bacterium]